MNSGSVVVMATEYTIEKQKFGSLPDGRDAHLFILSKTDGLQLRISNYGGSITSLSAPDRNGTLDDVVLGYPTLDRYTKDHPFLGTLIGRYANRIEEGTFTLDDQTYTLSSNDGPHHLHGGPGGFYDRLWETSSDCSSEEAKLELSYTSQDGEEQYPGTLSVDVTYKLTDDTLAIEYRARTDRKTIVNLTNHAYFNLSGHEADDILNHRLTLDANHFTPIDETLIPTGEIMPVQDSPLDFTSPTPIGDRIEDDHPQLRYAGGYDHNFVINREENGSLTRAAHVFDPSSGRTLTVHTTKPGIQFYSGNLLEGQLPGKDGATYDQHSGFCLEPQHFPDSPNKPNFPSPVLEPGETYRHTSTYKFGTRSG